MVGSRSGSEKSGGGSNHGKGHGHLGSGVLLGGHLSSSSGISGGLVPGDSGSFGKGSDFSGTKARVGGDIGLSDLITGRGSPVASECISSAGVTS